MLKNGFEILVGVAVVYTFYRGFMGVSYEVLDWFLTKWGYPETK